MTTKTRYFVISSLLVLGVGLGVGLVAYSVGLPNGAFARHAGPDELRYVPRDAVVIAYANVHDVMTSELRQRVHQMTPGDERGQREFQTATGINIETDIDRVVACLEPSAASVPQVGMVVASGRFDEVKIESLMRAHGAQVQDYKGRRLIAAEPGTWKGVEPPDSETVPEETRPGRQNRTSFALAFLKPGVVAVGSTEVVRRAIDLEGGGDSVTGNDELMTLVKALDSGNAWAVGRFDALRTQAHLPAGVASQLPPITWFSVAGHINGGISGTLRAETRDEEAASNLRDVVRGFMALAKLQAGNRPEMQAMMQSLQLGGTGKTVALSFTVPAQALDLLGAGHQGAVPQGH